MSRAELQEGEPKPAACCPQGVHMVCCWEEAKGPGGDRMGHFLGGVCTRAGTREPQGKNGCISWEEANIQAFLPTHKRAAQKG